MFVRTMSTGFERIGKDSQLQDHWIRRLVAFIIDSIIISACIFVIIAIIAIPLIILGMMTGFPWYLLDLFSFPFFAGILSVSYFAFFEAYYGSTFGKRIMNLKTTKLDGQKLPLDLAFVRNISKIYWILVLIDTVVGLATPGDPHQKLSDRYAGTIVSSTSVSPFPSVVTAKPTAKFCPYCGQKLPKDASYCPYCGKGLH